MTKEELNKAADQYTDYIEPVIIEEEPRVLGFGWNEIMEAFKVGAKFAITGNVIDAMHYEP